VPLALTGYELGLLIAALVFIAFALVVALVIPRGRPAFPGNRLGVFIGICVALFAVQMGAVLLLAEVGEADEPVAHEGSEPEPTEPTPTAPTDTETETMGTTETETTGETETETETGATGEGDPVAGKEVFLGSAGCGSCHTLADAGTSGTIGPNLDDAQPSFELAVDRVTNGAGAMPPFAGTLTEQQIADVAAYVSSAAG
jgi:mono/diheme cytochrome c family protein